MDVKKILLIFILIFISGCLPTKPTPATTLPAGQAGQVNIYLVAPGDNGQTGQKFGCDDSLVPITQPVPSGSDQVEFSLSYLLSLKDQFYGESGLYNSLYQSDLKLEKLDTTDGVANVYLIGQFALGGSCDNPRFEAQIRQTLMQFPQIQEVNIYINGVNIDKSLSGSGLDSADVLDSCAQNFKCQEGYFCYHSKPGGMTPNGYGEGEEQGDLMCHKICQTNQDCQNTNCQTTPIIGGDIAISVKFCM